MLVHTTLVGWEITVHGESHVHRTIVHQLLHDLVLSTDTVCACCTDLVCTFALGISALSAAAGATRRWALAWACWVLGRGRNMVSAWSQTVRVASLSITLVKVITTCDDTAGTEPVPGTVSTIAAISSRGTESSVL